MLIRKFIGVMLIVILVFGMVACGDTKVIEGIEYDTYGLINKNDNRNPDVKYKIIIGNIIWSTILVGTIVAPIYFLGFSIYEPVRKKLPNEKKGQI